MRRTIIRIVSATMSAIAAAVLCVGVSAAPSEPTTGPVRYEQASVITVDDISYVSLVDLAERFRLRLAGDTITNTMILSRGERTLALSHGSPIADRSGVRVNLVHPARLIRGSVWAPALTVLPLMSSLVPGDLAWDRERRAILVTGLTTTIAGVHTEHKANGTLIDIRLAELLDYTAEVDSTGWLTVDIAEGSFHPDSLSVDSAGGLIREVRAFQHEGGAQLAFLLSDRVLDVGHVIVLDGPELRITLHAAPDPAPVAEPDPLAVPLPTITENGSPAPTAEQWRIDTVVIDPGHGGKDPGAVGRGGTLEKDIVLAVALALRDIIEERGEIRAVLTRDSDVFIPLKERAAIAAREHGKLFISIHVDGHKNRKARGMSAYFLSEAKTEAALEVARRENASLRFEEDESLASIGMDGPLPDELQDLIDIQMMIHTDVFIGESQDMCEILLDTVSNVTRQDNRGVRQGPFYVMLGTQGVMPSVLFETGYISNADEEKMLKRVSHQKRLAQAIYDAVITFKRRHENGIFRSE